MEMTVPNGPAVGIKRLAGTIKAPQPTAQPRDNPQIFNADKCLLLSIVLLLYLAILCIASGMLERGNCCCTAPILKATFGIP